MATSILGRGARSLRSAAFSWGRPLGADLCCTAAPTCTGGGGGPPAAPRPSLSRGYAGGRERDSRYAQLQESDLDAFRTMLGPGGVLTDTTSLEAANKCAFTPLSSKVGNACTEVRPCIPCGGYQG